MTQLLFLNKFALKDNSNELAVILKVTLEHLHNVSYNVPKSLQVTILIKNIYKKLFSGDHHWKFIEY